MNKWIVAIGLLVVMTIVGLSLLNRRFQQTDNVTCTLEAKVCPDGSSVGRMQPSCEFAPCPDESTSSMLPNQADLSCTGEETPSLTEGPYYKVNTPERTTIRESGTAGEPLTLAGFVLDTNCQPISSARLDFWQADGNGVYDNAGYKLRGHQFTDSTGKYTLATVVPGRYPGRTPHIHVKVRALNDSPVLTTQLFIPSEPQNQTDSIFDASLVMDMPEDKQGKSAMYHFVITKN